MVRDMLAVWNADELTEVAELLTSELVANAVRHAMTAVDLDVSWDDPTLRVEVRDGSPDLPVIREVPGADGGYGLRIVGALARECGARRLDDDGKSVWFTVRRGDGLDQPSGV